MTTSVSNEPSSAAGSDRRRGPWLIAGAVLWLIVGAAAIFVVKNRTRDEDQSVVQADPDLSPISEKALREGTSRKRIIARPVDASALPVWDPEGIADFQLTERSGRTITKADLLGKPWIVSFIFTQCRGPCLDVTNSMTRLQTALKDVDVRLVTISVDPERDSAQVLNSYAEGYGADPERWLFLTGDKKTIYDLTLKSFLMPIEEATGEARVPGFEVIHTTNLLLVDERGVVQAKYDGRQPEQVGKLIERLTGPAEAELPPVASVPSAEARP